MIVFPCRHEGGDMIDRAVAHAQAFMPDQPILVVDSHSPDRTYMDRMPDSVEIADVKNYHYATGAYLWAMNNRPADFYYLFHDSLLINDDLTDLQQRDVTAVRWFAMPHTGWGVDQNGEDLAVWAGTAYRGQWLRTFQGVFGPMLACTHRVLEQIAARMVKPATTKYEECAMERLWGMAVTELGYDLTGTSIQGQMFGYFDHYPTARVDKVLMARL